MLNKSSFDLEGVVLEDTVEVTEEPSFADTMKDFWKYKQGNSKCLFRDFFIKFKADFILQSILNPL